MDGGHSSNEESQFIDPESLFVESQINKKPKKISNVRFAPEATAINTSICSEDGGDFSEPLSENEIKTEICSYLPSNTLGRRRLQTLNKYHAAKSLTLPHRSSKTDNDIPLSRLRHRSFAAPNKPNFLATLGRHATPKQSFTFEDIQDSTDDFKDFFTEEEKKKELSNIRNIPIRIILGKIMKRNHHSKIPLKDGSDCTVSKVKSKNIPSNQLSEEIESSFSREIHASEDHLAKMQFKHPSKLPRVMSKEKDSSVGNVPEKKIESRNKGFSDHKNPHYNKNSRFEDSRYYSTDYDNRGDIPHKRTKETERDEEVSYHDKLYYKDSSRSENYKRTKEIEMDKRSHSGRPYYNAQFEDQNYYSANYNDRTDFSHKRTKEIEVDKRSHTGKPYYNTQFEDQNDCSANYNDRTDISHKRTKEIERDKRSRTEISDNYRPYDNARLRSEDPNYYSAGYDDSFDVSHKRTKEMERDRRGLIGDSNHRRPYYNEAISIEDENYLSIGHENQADVPHEKTKDRSGKRKLELQKENPSHTEIGYHSSINAHIPFHSETASVADCDRIPNATKIPDAGHEIYDEKSTMSKQLFWSRKKDFLHGYDNRGSFEMKKVFCKILRTDMIQFCHLKCLDLLGCFKHASAALELWNDSLKRIEGLQGTGVVSYFVFLRWLIALNLILFILYFLLVTLPHAAFYVLPLKDISIAPNESVITEEFLNKYDKPRPTEFKPKETKNSSLRLHSDDLFSNWGILLDNLPDNILDITLAYDKRNYTSAERRNFSEYCEARYRTEMENNTGGILSAMQDLLQGTGWLQSTILFLGYYPANEISYFGLVYNMPVAVIAVLFVSFVICLCMMIQYSSHGVHETILARKNDYLQYSNILFCSWDYCIEDRKSSVIRHNSILHEIKSTLAEERRKREIKEWSRGKKIKVYFLRTFINLFVIAALCSSYYLIYRVVNYQLEEMQLHRLNKPGVNTLFIQYLSPIVITGLNIFVPIIFNNIVRFEMYNTQTQINMALFRTVFLRLSSVFVLVGLLYQQITCEPRDMCGAGMSETCRSPICWETYVGQQLYKLAVTDFFVYVMMFILYDVPRDVIVRHFKNKVTQMVGRQVFDLPNQAGVVYSPLLPAITVIKFIAIFYIKKQMVLKYCVPAPIPYKASRSNAMFMIILMLSFFTLMIIHGYSLSKVEPSPACSPFRHYFVMTEALSDTVLKRSTTFASIFNFFFSALFLIPAIILMCIAIYYYWTIVVAHRKMVKVLKAQIAIEGHDKQFLLNRLTEVAKGQFYK
ncbi:Transmembrane channel-like protein 7 like protein [Argiope bruennichi]|uniref:Transmembrane channel-like protein 7 like protein n=1 Tax=Argiope bruennichi TaxID=94029 RepID=A0A8T0EAJ6_ARGBR|nr:Transmembrane channel-like protein 7 like protein [Argiope bruennichi]